MQAAIDGRVEPMRVVFARHGETSLNVEKRFRGRADVPLTPRGWEQAVRLGAALACLEPQLLLTSPRWRAVETARAISAQTSVEAQVEGRLEDIDYGGWTGLARAEVAQRWPSEYAAYLSEPERVAFPEGESFADVEGRVDALLGELAQQPRLHVVALVTHDVIIRIVLCRLLGAPLHAMHRLRVDTASTTSISLGRGEATIDWMNNTSHLKPALP